MAGGDFDPGAVLDVERPTADHPGLMLSFDSQQRSAVQALLHVHEALSRTVNVPVMNQEATVNGGGPREIAHGPSLCSATLAYQGAMARIGAAGWPYSPEVTRRIVSR